MFLLWVYVSILTLFNSCIGENVGMHAYSPGDIIIGGLFPFHFKARRDEETGKIICSDFDFHGVLLSEMMIYAIREINQHRPLPNYTIGYAIYDTCSHVSLAIRGTLQMLKSKSDPAKCPLPGKAQFAFNEPGTKVVIGGGSSEISTIVARILAVSSVAQMSYSSTSELLNQKHKFPTFLRTVPSDAHQTKGIVELARKFNWISVAIVGSDDAYGKYGSDSLNEEFEKQNVCVEFVETLPSNFNQNQSDSRMLLDELVNRISDSSAEAIILFTKATNVELIMNEAISRQLNRTWVASDSWSTETKIATLQDIHLAGQVFGFTFMREAVAGFEDFVRSNESQYPVCRKQLEKSDGRHCKLPSSQAGSKQCLDLKCLGYFIEKNSSYSLYIAVQVIAESLRRLMRCDDQRCERTSNFTALELFKEIQKTNCTVDKRHIFFDNEGNANLGYDIVQWIPPNNVSTIPYETIGRYWPGKEIEVYLEHLVEAMNDVEVTVYGCHKTCKPGSQLKTRGKPCCHTCELCAKGEFSTGNGLKCQSCSEDESSNEQCNYEYFSWSSAFSIAVSCFAVFGMIVAFVFGILFIIYRDTPIVRAVGGYLCFVELLSLQVCFCVTFSFPGEPTNTSCRIGLPAFGAASSLCISCILANLLQILVGFDFHMKVGSWMKKLNRPGAVVIVVSGVQLALSVLWLVHEPPVPHKSNTNFVHLCKLESFEFFAITITYNALLALICFAFAFKGRELPDLYRNAVLISVSMLLFLIIWLIFVPLFLTLETDRKAGVESAAILIFTYSILCCHLAPKCYIIVFRKELNNERAITEYIRKHYECKGKAVVKS